MAGKRLPQNNQPVMSPTDFQERRAKLQAKEAQRARIDNLQKRVAELQEAEKAYTARIQTLEANSGFSQADTVALNSELLNLQRENIELKKEMKVINSEKKLLKAETLVLGSELLNLQRENIEMKKAMKAIGKEKKPLEDPIDKDDLALNKKPAKARKLPRQDNKSDEDEVEKKLDEKEL